MRNCLVLSELLLVMCLVCAARGVVREPRQSRRSHCDHTVAAKGTKGATEYTAQCLL